MEEAQRPLTTQPIKDVIVQQHGGYSVVQNQLAVPTFSISQIVKRNCLNPLIYSPIGHDPVHHHTSNAPPRLINQSSLMNTIPTSLTTSTDQLLPPVPPRIRERIIKGEYIDFTTLLPKTMFSSGSELDSSTSFTIQLPHNNDNLSVYPSAKTRKTTSFSYQMKAWNVTLLSVLTTCNHKHQAQQHTNLRKYVTSSETLALL